MRDESSRPFQLTDAGRSGRVLRDETAQRSLPEVDGTLSRALERTTAADLDREIRRLAECQWDVIAREQLIAFGASKHQLSRRIASGALVPVHPGVYAVGHSQLTRRGKELAAVLSLGDSALLAGRAAAALWGLIDPVDVIEVVIDYKRTPRRKGVKVRRTAAIPKQDRRTRHRIPVASPLRTLLDLAAIPGFADLELAVARAIKRGLVSRESLEERVGEERGRPGIARLRAILNQDGGPRFTRSVLERRFLKRLREAGIAAPRTEVAFGDYILDFLWPAERLVVETDGYDTHGTESAFNSDRARDADLKSRGYEVLRFTWRQIDDEPMLVIARLSAVLAIARLRSPARG